MTNKRPFRFGVTAISGAASREEWRTKARSIEEAGYATLVIPDHLVTLFSPIPALQSAADATNKLRVGSFVFDVADDGDQHALAPIVARLAGM
jgi:alkanesulfonate monooxygenase SsuD/methylene tetrahydromethanopterin reductase-like flavin-dependent oxidoreductase (luciferase family)